MSVRDWGRWSKAKDAGGDTATTEVMLVPGGVLVRTREFALQGTPSSAMAFVPIDSPDRARIFLTQLGCGTPPTSMEAGT